MSTIVDSIRSGVKNWWWFLISGILFIAVGIAIFAKPAEGYVSLSILFSILMISTGFTQIFFSTANSGTLRGWGWILVSGIIDLALGTYLLIYPVVTMATLPYFVGFWLIFRSFSIMGSAFDLRDLHISGWGWLLFGGILVLIGGFLIVYYPAAGVLSIIAVSGSAFLLGGITNIYFAFQLKDLGKDVQQIRNAIA